MKNIFGTDGIRATTGSYPLTPQDLPKVGYSIGLWIINQFGINAQIIIASDTRISGKSINHALMQGLQSFPIQIYDAGILPTPAIAVLVQKQTQFSCGIIISASHNPYHDNGIKIITKNGKTTLEDELFISAHLHNHFPISYSEQFSIVHFQQASALYANIVINQFPVQFLQGKTIVLDCANGATSWHAPALFSQLGAHTITINAEPNGFNINHHCGSLYPNRLQSIVKAIGAHAGFAFDGDGDRILAINSQGEIKDGDDIVALLMMHPQYHEQKYIVGTIMSNQGLEHYLHAHHKNFIRTKVGDKYVFDALTEHNALLGGEPSGHIIMRDYASIGDGIFTALKIMETISLTNNYAMETYHKWPQYSINLPITIKKDLSKEPFETIITEHQEKLKEGRLLVRYSGTESLLRIMVEHTDFQYAQIVADSLAQTMQALL